MVFGLSELKESASHGVKRWSLNAFSLGGSTHREPYEKQGRSSMQFCRLNTSHVFVAVYTAQSHLNVGE